MKRSRRSLSLLLGLMAASLSVVRATTPGGDPPAAGETGSSLAALVDAPSPRSRAARPSREVLGGRGVLAGGSPRLVKPRFQRGLSADGAGRLRGTIRRPKQPASPFMTRGRPASSQLIDPERGTAPRAVSATSVIVIIPDMSGPGLPRAGWSGCSAYAVGCDHLGRSVRDRRDDAMVGALSMPRVGQAF